VDVLILDSEINPCLVDTKSINGKISFTYKFPLKTTKSISI